MSELAVILLAAFAIQSLFAGLPKGHDILLHYYRIPAIQSLWANGIIYSRWLPDVTLGYGSPLFNFYPPLSAYLAATIDLLLGGNAPLALTAVLGLSLAAAAAGMYLLGRALYGPAGGALAAAAYTLSPHLLYQIYARGSTANAWAMALYPWAVWSLWRLAKEPTARRTAVAGLAVAGVLLSHIAAGFLFVSVLAVTAGIVPLAAVSTGGDGRKRAAWFVWLAIGLGLALAAFSWLPALQEFPYTQYDRFAGDVDYTAHFARAWAWPERAIAGLNNAPLPKTVGVVTLALGLAGLVVSARRLLRHRPFSHPSVLPVTLALLALVALYLSTAPAQWVWEMVAPLRRLQFPWRLLDIATFGLAVATGSVAPALARRRRLRPALIGGSLAVLAVTALPYLYPPRLDALPAEPTLGDITAAEQAFGILGLTAWGEYTAATVPAGATTRQSLAPQAGGSLADRVITTTADIVTVATTPLRAELRVAFDEAGSLRFAHHFFPGWQATVDGRPVPAGPDAAGLVSVAVPAGEHVVTVFFGRTPVRALADGLSLLAALTTMLLFFGRPRGRSLAMPPPGRRALSPLVPLVLLILVVAKAGWLDRATTPLVLQPGAGSLPTLPRPQWGNFGDRLQLLAYELEATGELTLYWRARQRLADLYAVSVTLADARGIPVKTIIKERPGRNVTSTWNEGDVVRDVYALPLDLVEPPAGYRVRVSVLAPDGVTPLPLIDSPDRAVTEVVLGTLKTPPPPAAVSATATAVNVVFGDAIELSHIALPASVRRGETLPLTLYWRSLAPVADDYTVFLHLFDGDGAFVAGNDGQPLAGLYPTSFWVPGETIADPHPWPLDLPPGRYQVQAGLYLLESGARLPTPAGDVVALGEVVVRSEE